MKGEEKKCRIVILDNDPICLKIWEKILGRIKNCHYFLTNDPAVAKKMIETEEVDLVISEIVLPKLCGYLIAEITKKFHPKADVILTTTYDCNLSRFDLKDPHFHILHKPYNNIDDIQKFIYRLLNHEDVFSDASKDSFSKNSVFPQVVEWKL